MTKKDFSLYTTTVCATAITSPGRFVCGLILAFEICILMIMEIMFSKLIKILKIEKLYKITMLCSAVFFLMLIRQVTILISPEIALQMGFVIYFPAISVFVTVLFKEKNENPLKKIIKSNMRPALIFSAYTASFALMRDILGFGTISFFSASGLSEKILFSTDKISILTFIATIPGAVIFTALIVYIFSNMENRFKILEKAGVIN